ncbi:MAG TPA: hypothetical protein VHE81_08970, partial [Lacipirellulaceae bacterium]|nr:hypothetical protein [Lacipirellulaceae bacterium]
MIVWLLGIDTSKIGLTVVMPLPLCFRAVKRAITAGIYSADALSPVAILPIVAYDVSRLSTNALELLTKWLRRG